MNDKKNLRLVVKELVFKKDSYSIIKAIDLKGKKITIKGYDIPFILDATIDVLEYKYDKNKKDCIFVNNFLLTDISYESLIKNYIGNIEGATDALVKKIMQAYPTLGDLRNVLLNKPSEILSISDCFNMDTIKSINSLVDLMNEERELAWLLSHFTDEPVKRTVMESCKQIKDKIYQNPFHLLRYNCFDINKIISGYRNLGFDFTDTDVDQHIAVYVMNMLRIKNGSTVFKLNEVKEKIREFKNIEDDSFFNERKIFSVIKSKGEIFVSLRSDIDKEKYIANRVYDLAKTEYRIKDMLLEKLRGNLDDTQLGAVATSVSHGFSVITGGPGTGKSTTLKVITRYLKKNNISYQLIAPTGKASKRMTEICGDEARTIHSFFQLNKDFSGEDEDLGSCDEINTDYIIIDECSMLTLSLMQVMLKRVSKNTSFILLGDVNQLEAIGAGKVLEDLISSGIVPVTVLKKVYRQDSENYIAINALKIKNGDVKSLEYNNTFCKMKPSLENILKAYTRAVELYGDQNVIILSPYRKKGKELSTDEINKFIKSNVNKTDEEPLYGFNINDRVMQTSNDSEKGIANGSVGKVINIDRTPIGDFLTVEFDGIDKPVLYSQSELKKLTLAYAVSVHKSQGSEYKAVLFVCTGKHAYMLNKKIIYTAITRAKSIACIFTEGSTLEEFSTYEGEKRKTLLSSILKKMSK